ncbi:MAG: ASCH domain-containing protein [Polyangiaceae bacterium]|jgi:hypothetical protein
MRSIAGACRDDLGVEGTGKKHGAVVLSIRQPWVELILSGRKPIEVRTWRTKHRGALWLHAGLRIDAHACAAYGVPTTGLTIGAIVGSVDVEDCIEFSEETWRELQHDHLNVVPFDRPYFGWLLRNPKRVQPIPIRGALGLFIVPHATFTSRIRHA